MEDMNKEPSMDPDALQATLASQSETSEEDTSAHGGGRFESGIGKIETRIEDAEKLLLMIGATVALAKGLRDLRDTSRELIRRNGDGDNSEVDRLATVIRLLTTATNIATGAQGIRNTTRSFRKAKD